MDNLSQYTQQNRRAWDEIAHIRAQKSVCLSGKDGQIIIEDDYFGRPVQYPPGWRHFAGGEQAQEPVYEAVWPLGDIVTTLAQVGLIIESLQEFPSRAKWRFGDQLDLAQRLPGGFLLLARK
jgi:hypothetical protein